MPFVSLDVDALDPAFAPGLSHREPGGLSVRDVVEYNPTQDVDGRTAPVWAKLVIELAGQMVIPSSEAGESGP